MLKLDAPETHILNAALGWVELGNAREARAELRSIRADLQGHPSVLLVNWEILACERRWMESVVIAEEVIQKAPDWVEGWIKRSYSLHELKRTREAYDLLLPARQRFPSASIIPYNLACYACQLGNLPEAQIWLGRAIKLAGRKEIVSMGLKDPDLEPLREYLEGL